MKYYDLEAIQRFVDAVSKNVNEANHDIAYKRASGQHIDTADELDKITLIGVEMADIRAAHRALAALLYAEADLKKELGLKKKPGPKKSRLNRTTHGFEFQVLCSFEGGAIKYQEAVELLKRWCFVEETAAGELITNQRAGARRFIDSFPDSPEGWQPFLSREELEKLLMHKTGQKSTR